MYWAVERVPHDRASELITVRAEQLGIIGAADLLKPPSSGRDPDILACVGSNPVSTPNSLRNREINSEFRKIRPSTAIFVARTQELTVEFFT
jgi:hypothetical protein